MKLRGRELPRRGTGEDQGPEAGGGGLVFTGVAAKRAGVVCYALGERWGPLPLVNPNPRPAFHSQSWVGRMRCLARWGH